MREDEALDKLCTYKDTDQLIVEIYNQHRLEIQKISDNYQIEILKFKAKNKDEVKKISLEFIEIVSKLKKDIR